MELGFRVEYLQKYPPQHLCLDKQGTATDATIQVGLIRGRSGNA